MKIKKILFNRKKQQPNSDANTSITISDESITLLKKRKVELENHLIRLETEKSEIEKTIFEFNRRHSFELGHLILIILKKTAEMFEGIASKFEEFTRANKEYEDYKSETEETLKKVYYNLTSEEKDELKTLYRKASKLTHPDVVADEHKNEAQKIFIEVKDAYDRNDLERVRCNS